jgi:hypothetical protein
LGALPPVTIHLLYFYLLSDSYQKTGRYEENMTDFLDWMRAQARIAKTDTERVTERYARIVIDLGTAREEVKINISGDYMGVAKFTGTASTTYFRLNHRNAREIYPSEIAKIYATYKHIYLSNAAEAGKELVLYVGGAMSGEIQVNTGKVGLKDSSGGDIDPATEDGNLATCASELATVNTELTAQGVEQDKLVTALEWSGTPYSTPKTSTNVVQKFEAGSKKLRDVIIRNTDATNAVDIGLYNATPATFRAASFEVAAASSVGFREVDLTLLGVLSSVAGNHAIVHVLGVTE